MPRYKFQNKETQTDEWDGVFCNDPDCEIHWTECTNLATRNDNEKKKLKKIATGVGIVGIAAVAGVGAVLAAPVLIGAAGFGAAGVAAGSVAAGVQSWIGAVGAGSLFASFQSAGVLGLAATTKTAVGATAAAAAGTTGGLLFATRKNGKTEDQVTQTTGCSVFSNMTKKVTDQEPETDGFILVTKVTTKANDSQRLQIETDQVLPRPRRPEEIVNDRKHQIKIQGRSQKPRKNSNGILADRPVPVRLATERENSGDHTEIQLNERLHESRENESDWKDRIQARAISPEKTHESLKVHDAAKTKVTDQETQTQNDKPKSSVQYVDSGSEADLTSDEEDIQLEFVVEEISTPNPGTLSGNPSKVTQTFRRPIRSSDYSTSQFVKFW